MNIEVSRLNFAERCRGALVAFEASLVTNMSVPLASFSKCSNGKHLLAAVDICQLKDIVDLKENYS